MTRRTFTACLPLALLAAGCLDEPRANLIGGGGTTAKPLTTAQRQAISSPATEATAQRVLEVGRKLVLGNPRLGMRPLFITVGAPKPEIFHKGGGIEGVRLYPSEK